MSKGRKKGFKKDVVEIRDTSINPYYIIKEERQFVLMLEGNTLPQGYYVKLSHALSDISKSVHLAENAGEKLNIRDYISSYDSVQNKILSAINV